MFDPKKFTTPAAKPLPVVLLLDVSGSMSGSKIDNLNNAVRDMLNTFAQEEKMETEILVSIITFGPVALYLPFTKASQVEWKDLKVNGATPMGGALNMAKAMIEDKETTPSRAYRPTIVLVSDGHPTDSWEKPLENFVKDGRSSKCDRMAMAIGHGAGTVLSQFIKGTENPLFNDEDGSKIHEFFQRVTMSVTMRSQSKNPNEAIPLLAIAYDGIKTSAQDKNKSDDDKGYW